MEQRTVNDDDDDGTDMSSASDAVTEGESQPDSRTDNQTLARLLEEGEKVIYFPFRYSCLYRMILGNVQLK